MVGARAEFLGAGHYLPLANALAELSLDHAAGARFILEAGAGTGYYIASVLDALPKSLGLAIDLSKYAVRRAAKAHSRLSAAVADIWEGLPTQGSLHRSRAKRFCSTPSAGAFPYVTT
jgi:23S rRNA (guanine745-N1)-methyltransferase